MLNNKQESAVFSTETRVMGRALWKWVFGNISIILWLCWRKHCKDLDGNTPIWILFLYLPNEEFEGVLNAFVKNIKMHYPQISFARISDWDLRRKKSVGHILTKKKKDIEWWVLGWNLTSIILWSLVCSSYLFSRQMSFNYSNHWKLSLK